MRNAEDIRRTIAGFVIAPLVPGVLIAGLMLALSEREDALSMLKASVIFAYPIAFLLGVPSHAVLLRYGWTSWPAYVAAGALLGALVYVAAPALIEAAMLLQGVDAGGHVMFSAMLFPVAAACGAIAAASFWPIARPDRRNPA